MATQASPALIASSGERVSSAGYFRIHIGACCCAFSIAYRRSMRRGQRAQIIGPQIHRQHHRLPRTRPPPRTAASASSSNYVAARTQACTMSASAQREAMIASPPPRRPSRDICGTEPAAPSAPPANYGIFLQKGCRRYYTERAMSRRVTDPRKNMCGINQGDAAK